MINKDKTIENNGSKLEKTLFSLVPFSYLKKSIAEKCLGKGEENFLKNFNYYRIQSFSMLLSLVGALIYCVGSISYGTPNFKKWTEISKQRCLEKKTEFYAESKNLFNKYDANKDETLSQDEFNENYKADWSKYQNICWEK